MIVANVVFAAAMVHAAASPASCTHHVTPNQTVSSQTIRTLETAWSRAYYSGDTAYLECLYAPTFESIGSDGSVGDRRADIDSSLAAKHRPRRKNLRIVHMDVYVNGTTAIATTLEQWSATSGALVRMRVSDIYAFDGSRWHAVFSQDTKLK